MSDNLLIGTVPASLSAFAGFTNFNITLGRNLVHGTVPPALLGRFPVNSSAWSGNCITGAASRPAACDFADRDALMDVYVATAGWGWTNSGGWGSTSGTPCDGGGWYGVACDAGGARVVGLVLSQNNLVGSLPDSIGSMTALTCVKTVYRLLYEQQWRTYRDCIGTRLR